MKKNVTKVVAEKTDTVKPAAKKAKSTAVKKAVKSVNKK